MQVFIYLTTNKVNQKYYIGVHATNNIKRSYLGSGKALKKAFKKYGRHNFSRIILEYFETEEEAYDRERDIVNEDFIKNPNNYNLIIGGRGCADRRKISKANKGKIPWNKGKSLPDEMKKKISNSLKGNKSPNKGKRRSEETKRKISIGNKGKKRTKEFKNGVSKFMTGQKFSEERKNKTRGENSAVSKLKTADVHMICLMCFKKNISREKIIKKFKNYNEATIDNILYNKTWKHISKNYQ